MAYKQTLIKLIDAVIDYLESKVDGTVILMGEDDGWGKLVINNNNITSLVYKSLTGKAAFAELEKLNEINFLLRQTNDKSATAKVAPGESITTEEFFDHFGITFDSQTDQRRPTEKINKSDINRTSAKKVLVVDDSVIARNAVSKPLLNCGFEIFEATDGFDALSKLDQVVPDLIIMDLIMPGIDGYKVIDLLKNNRRFNHLPVIMVTSKSSLMDKVKGKMSPTDAYITKPFKDDDLLRTVIKILKKAE